MPFDNSRLQDIIPCFESNDTVQAGRGHRGLADRSLGGGQRLNIDVANADAFAEVGGFSSTSNTKPADVPAFDPEVLKKLKSLYLSSGDRDVLILIGRGVHDALKGQEPPHVWRVDASGRDGALGANSCISSANAS